jgi:hypothetical protein
MSSAALVAWLKTSLPLPVSLRILVNVSSMFSPDWIASSSTPLFFISDPARSSTCLALTLAASPVLLSTAPVCAPTFWACANSSTPILIVAPSAANPAVAPASARPLSLDPNPDALLDASWKPRLRSLVLATKSTTTAGLATCYRLLRAAWRAWRSWSRASCSAYSHNAWYSVLVSASMSRGVMRQ